MIASASPLLSSQPCRFLTGKTLSDRLLTLLLAMLGTVFWGLFFTVHPVYADDISLSNLILNNSQGRINVRFGLDFSNLTPVKGLLDSGVNLTLVCDANLSEKREYLWNHSIVETSQYSKLERLPDGRYRLSPPGGGHAIESDDLAVVIQNGWRFISLDLAPWSLLSRGKAYTLHLTINLKQDDVAEWLRDASLFWSLDSFGPTTYKLDFSY